LESACNATHLQLSAIQKSFWQINVSTSEELSNILRQKIISTRAANSSIQVIMEQEMDGPDIC